MRQLLHKETLTFLKECYQAERFLVAPGGERRGVQLGTVEGGMVEL